MPGEYFLKALKLWFELRNFNCFLWNIDGVRWYTAYYIFFHNKTFWKEFEKCILLLNVFFFISSIFFMYSIYDYTLIDMMIW